MEDRRSRGRYRTSYPVRITTSQGINHGEMTEVSANGAFIHCEDPLETKDTVSLSIEFRAGSFGEMEAEVIWSTASDLDDAKTPHGRGVRFL